MLFENLLLILSKKVFTVFPFSTERACTARYRE